MTEKPPQVFAAISTVMGIMAKEGISKGRRNQQQGYNFRGIDDVYAALCGVLAENKLVILPFVREMQREERQTAKGGLLNYTILTVDFTLASAVDGSTATVRMIGEAMDSADKSSNKAQSAALKYAALQVFMIPTEGDNDADATTHELAKREEPQQPTLITAAQSARVLNLFQTTKSNMKATLNHFKVGNLSELTEKQAMGVINGLEEKLAKMAKDHTNHGGELANDSIPY